MLSREQIDLLPPRAQEVVEYRPATPACDITAHTRTWLAGRLVLSTAAIDGRIPCAVSHIEQITGELRAMAAGVDKAQGNIAAADANAQQIAARAAASGFTGIAASMSRLRNEIAEIRARLASAGISINEAATTAAAASKEMSPEQTIALLAPVQEKVSGVRDHLAATIAKVEQTKQLPRPSYAAANPGR